MADLIVSPVIDFVKQRVVAYLEDRIDLQSGAEGKLEKLETVLNRILPVANTAEEVDLEKHKDLKPWMRDLKVAVEEAKDVLDEFEYLRLKRQAEGDGVDDDEVHSFPSSSTGKRLKGIAGRMFIPSSLYNYAKKFIPSTDDPVLERLRSIQCKLEELDSRAVQFLQLVLDRKATDREHQNQDVRKRETSSSVVERELVGRKDVLEDIITKLREGEGEHICVISVVGHGGMGKTTVAQHVFNDTRVAAHFQVRMWAHVSQVFDVSALTKKIIESASPGERCANTDSLERLQQKLKDVLKSKRFLLVLDDVWYGQNRLAMEEEWNKLCSPLTDSGGKGKGSKILLTSRTWEVKELPGPLTTMISLEGLTQDECWSIIQTSAFRHSGICLELVPMGRQISLKVQGSPLAAKAVGGMLRKELSCRHWSNILNTELSKLPGNDLMPVLRLSYRYLPPQLRQCFAYCSLFPKGHIFNVDMLVRMWVAHGYIRDRLYGEMTEEDMGKSYFDDLLSAGFFTLRNVGDSKTTVMHDLMNDLAQFVTTDEILRIEEGTQYCPIPKMLRHLSVRTDYLPVLSKNNYRCNLSYVESFLLFPRRATYDSVHLDDKLVKEVLQQLRRVRVLDLSWCKVKELPEDISHWVHLRFFNTSMTQIWGVPDSLVVLYHLQVLSLSKSFKLRLFKSHLLEKLNYLVNLRFLGSDTHQRLKLTYIRGQKSLQLVTNLHVEEGRGSAIGNLKALNDLRGLLFLKDLHNIETGAAAREAELYCKNQLELLSLEWGGDCSPDVATEVLQGLQPPISLKYMYIVSYPGMMCPSWMCIPILENLTTIFLLNLFHLECLPPLGLLPFLEFLWLECLPRVRKLSQEGFPSLKLLKIKRMEELEEWSGPDRSGGLPCLHEFKITGCPKMRMCPTLSHTVTQLHIEAVGISSLQGLIVDQGIAANSGSSVSFSSKLSMVGIRDCRNLTTLGGLLQNQQCLKHLYIEDCPNLTWAAPREYVDHGLLPSSLEELAISHIDDNGLSRCLQAYLTSLQTLSISSCQVLTPSALKVLHALPSLKVLRINNCPRLLIETSSISAAVDGHLALERLEIDDPLMLFKVPVLKSLTSVQEVRINDATRLISFSPELGEWLLQNATSLRELTIEQEGWHLQSLPKLPDSIEEFWNVDQQFITRDEYKIREIKYTKIS